MLTKTGKPREVSFPRLMPGDLVRMNKDLDNKPRVMMVIRVVKPPAVKVTKISAVYDDNHKKPIYTDKSDGRVIGIEVGWFDANQTWNKTIMNFKDLELYEARTNKTGRQRGTDPGDTDDIQWDN